MHRDHRQPALEGARILEAGQRRQGAHEDVVVQIGEVTMEADHAVEHAVDMIGVALVEGDARPRIAAPERVNEHRVVPHEGVLRGRPQRRDELQGAGQARCLP